MDDKKWKQIMKKGYDQTTIYLNNLPENECFWKNYPKEDQLGNR